MKEIELIDKRKLKEKHFLQEDGTIRAELYDSAIHFKKNGKFEEIDNTLSEKNGFYSNKNNSFKVKFNKNTSNELISVEEEEYYLKINLLTKEEKHININKGKHTSKLCQKIKYEDIIKNIDIEYKLFSSKLKESIILKNKNAVKETIEFLINTNLDLNIDSDGSVSALNSGKKIFIIEKPYMVDLNRKYNEALHYELKKQGKDYILILHLDLNWLQAEERSYPVIIDPTITNYTNENSVYDTYIYPGDTNVDRNSQDILKCGVERINNSDRVNRSLIKFDLPSIGTGSQVVKATLNLAGYPILNGSYEYDIIDVHRVTADWNENTANWSGMNDKFDNRVEGAFESYRSSTDSSGNIDLILNEVDLTNLVAKWYTGTQNFGLMLKQNTESYRSDVLPSFFSKNNNVIGNNLKPILSIVYRNQNGLEDYMNLQTQNFCNGNTFVNTFNGNLIAKFDIGSTNISKLPIAISAVYNTNDVILNNNIGYGLGWRLNLSQRIKNLSIDNINYLEYIDEDGTSHYFLSEKKYVDENDNIITISEPNTYYDEDGLNFEIVDNNNYYILTDNSGNTYKFIKNNDTSYLTEICDSFENGINITYDGNNRITKVVNSFADEINISYANNQITINTPSKNIILHYENDRITRIEYPFGSVYFTYNANNIITSISDYDGKKITYSYYSQIPYRVQEIKEYGTDNTLGYSYSLLYEFNSTSIVDRDGKHKVIVFSPFGIAKSKSLVKNDDFLDGYGIFEKHIEPMMGINTNNNKLTSQQIPIRYVKNYISNSSFENDNIDFSGTNNLSISNSTDCSVSGFNSLKCVSSLSNQYMTREITVPKGNYYTFSGYIKNTNSVKLSLSYSNELNENIESFYEINESNTDFERYDLTINYPSNSTSNLKIKVYFNESGTTYLDDIQLEEGKIANKYNLIENSDFSNGLSDWEISAYDYNTSNPVSTSNIFSVDTLSNGKKALKLQMNPSISTEFSKTFKIKGKAGEAFNVSFWFKNKGLLGCSDMGELIYNFVILHFEYIDQSGGHGEFPSESFNPNESEWQFFSQNFIAEKDFKEITLYFCQQFDANEFYITNIGLFKDVRSTYYKYDEDGNIILTKNLNNQDSNYIYNNKEINQIINPLGGIQNIEYSKDNDKLMRSAISNSGISNISKYDAHGNLISLKTMNVNQVKTLVPGIYEIRLKGTDKLFNLINNTIIVKDNLFVCNKWIVEKVTIDSVDYYSIHHNILNNRYITFSNNNMILSAYSGNDSLLLIESQPNGSFIIRSKEHNKYLKYNNSNSSLIFSDFVDNDSDFEFYFENSKNAKFIESDIVYDENGKTISKTIDSNLNSKVYNISDSGKLNSITDSRNNIINYNYDSEGKIVSIVNGDKSLNYLYNGKTLSRISQMARNYNLIYNEFLKLQTIKIGDNIIILTNTYDDNNGNLLSTTFGNNQNISYQYDDFNRIKTITLADEVYNFEYDSHGNLGKIISNNSEIKYTYDMSNRIHKCDNGEFISKYMYDLNDNIIAKKYKIGNSEYSVLNTLDNDDTLLKAIIENNEFNYNYDSIGRLTNKNINNIFQTNYEFVKNGKRESMIIKSIINGNDKYEYKYDKNGNITHIYHNDNIENKYYYDKNNELIKEDNYLDLITIRYYYDSYGNILCKKKFNIDTYEEIEKIRYEYNNSNWPDQLSKYNNDVITYDSIGNPLSIGNSINLTWKNGEQLATYSDSIKNVVYKYNNVGIRTSKKINNIQTDYYLEGNNIIFEKTNDVCTYFMYSNNELVGLKYNNQNYFYIKNSKNDIIGILNSEYNLVAKYRYDSWGKIISITDSNNNDLSNDTTNIANINPFRYRSYYYDKETNLYYLNARYYNPDWGRFISIDECLNNDKNILSSNLYIYCGNNPINAIDYNGNKWFKNLAIKLANDLSNTYKLACTVAKTIGKAIGNEVSKAARAYGLIASSDLLSRSLNSHGACVVFGPQTIHADKVAYSSEFKELVDKKIKNKIYAGETEVTESFVYEGIKSVDAMLAYHKLSVKATPSKTYGSRAIDVVISDKYNFDLWSVKEHGLLPTIINNIGYYAVKAGIIEEYEFSIKFSYLLPPQSVGVTGGGF